MTWQKKLKVNGNKPTCHILMKVNGKKPTCHNLMKFRFADLNICQSKWFILSLDSSLVLGNIEILELIICVLQLWVIHLPVTSQFLLMMSKIISWITRPIRSLWWSSMICKKTKLIKETTELYVSGESSMLKLFSRKKEREENYTFSI